jgi:hypothetical protein
MNINISHHHNYRHKTFLSSVRLLTIFFGNYVPADVMDKDGKIGKHLERGLR